jgi:hypothetical protein
MDAIGCGIIYGRMLRWRKAIAICAIALTSKFQVELVQLGRSFPPVPPPVRGRKGERANFTGG